MSADVDDRPVADPASPDPMPDNSLGGILRAYLAKIKGGEVGSLPAVLGLIALVVVFSALRPEQFTNSFNFANLIGQSAGVTVLAMGLVFVLLLGEIDLSAGFAGGTCAGVLGVFLTRQEWPLLPALVAALLTGAVIGLLIGLLVARLGIPSFVVTLAAFLGLQGVLLTMIGEGGTIPYRNDFINGLNNANLPVWLGWTLGIVCIVGYAVSTYVTDARRRAKNLTVQPILLWALKTGLLTVVVLAVVGYLSVERSRNPALTSLKGVPVSLLVIVGLLIVLTFMLTRTAWGRHVYAVGGNAEAARRAGINVFRVRLSCFILCSTMAAMAGIMIASRTNSVNPNTGGETTLLYAVGAAVIGGTSLFGGKGRVIDAVIGGTVVAVIDNGMGLLDQPQGTVWMVTGLVLLVAASVDALSRRRASATGHV
ncbi:ABC transporter permease [Nocardioides sp. KC13]|uniref:Xylose transport system permease protein XylH n=1 Tax=Nocardioides turkmenicus TaxID=2711220 RepID=A0A6M1R0T1_9ACTN|nr:ABC transporter permease [Nocardioides sp. KC13]NGN93854.1 ABC transporter permease [Nocardioides sp. KC13]